MTTKEMEDINENEKMEEIKRIRRMAYENSLKKKGKIINNNILKHVNNNPKKEKDDETSIINNNESTEKTINSNEEEEELLKKYENASTKLNEEDFKSKDKKLSSTVDLANERRKNKGFESKNSKFLHFLMVLYVKIKFLFSAIFMFFHSLISPQANLRYSRKGDSRKKDGNIHGNRNVIRARNLGLGGCGCPCD